MLDLSHICQVLCCRRGWGNPGRVFWKVFRQHLCDSCPTCFNSRVPLPFRQLHLLCHILFHTEKRIHPKIQVLHSKNFVDFRRSDSHCSVSKSPSWKPRSSCSSWSSLKILNERRDMICRFCRFIWSPQTTPFKAFVLVTVLRRERYEHNKGIIHLTMFDQFTYTTNESGWI